MPRWYAPWRRGRRAAIISFYFSVHTRLSRPEIDLRVHTHTHERTKKEIAGDPRTREWQCYLFCETRVNANQSSFTLLLRALWKRACFHLFPILHWFASLLVINSLKEKRERCAEEKGLYREGWLRTRLATMTQMHKFLLGGGTQK